MKKIIIAEDDPGIQDATKLILERAGYDVTAYFQADPILANCFEIPDLFILDKQLSGINGIAVCRHLKNQELTAHIPVIMISATADIRQQANLAGADHALEKPFRMKVLTDTVERLINAPGKTW